MIKEQTIPLEGIYYKENIQETSEVVSLVKMPHEKNERVFIHIEDTRPACIPMVFALVLPKILITIIRINLIGDNCNQNVHLGR